MGTECWTKETDGENLMSFVNVFQSVGAMFEKDRSLYDLVSTGAMHCIRISAEDPGYPEGV